MTTDLLEQRLENLAVNAPDPGAISARVLTLPKGARARRWPRVALSAVATVVLLALTAYFVPAADAALASRLPWTGEILQWGGLVGARDRIAYVDSTATSSGYRLELEGVYADSTRTMLLMHADPAIAGPDYAVLTDQFARTYRIDGSSSNMLTGDIVMQFEPLAWPDSITGARITLHVSHLQTPSGASVHGTWELTAALGVDQAKALAAPASADLGPADFRFTAVSYTPATIEVDMEVTGVSGDELWRMVPNGGKGEPALLVDLVSPSGENINGNGDTSGESDANHVRVFGFRSDGGGQYVVRVSYYGYGSFERVLEIP